MIIKHRRVQQKDIRDIQLKFSKIFKKKYQRNIIYGNINNKINLILL